MWAIVNPWLTYMLRVYPSQYGVLKCTTHYEILKTLASYAGKLRTHTRLLQKVWGQPHDLAKLRVFMNQLRRKIEDKPAQPR